MVAAHPSSTHGQAKLLARRQSFDAGELRAFLPEPFGCAAVFGLRGGGGGPAFEKVTAADIGDLRGRGEVHNGFRAFLGRDRKQLRNPQDEREQSAAFFAQAAGDEARMQAVDGDASTGPLAREFAREQDRILHSFDR